MIRPCEADAAAQSFQAAGEFLGAAPFGSGHINDSYRVVFREGGSNRSYLLQRINTRVFTDPAALMQNVERVTSHIARQVAEAPDHDRRVLALIPSKDDRSFYMEANGGCWRMMPFIEGAQTLDRIEFPHQAFHIAAAFGRFQQQLASLPAPQLNDTIPDFHNTAKRFEALEKTIESDDANRVQFAGSEIASAIARKAMTSVLLEADLPERIAHNDTKSSNVLLDDVTGEGLCVIDLDTVMPGLALYDFGDMVRSMASSAAEDERDLSRIELQFPVFEALVRGYLETAGGLLAAREKQFLAFSGKLITFENGLRFLSDYLSGDIYYKVHREGHNLDRCRAQFKLVESIERQEGRMNGLVETLT
jgi:aminoglycoside phosphotransferase (APT) family kinase protein